MQAQAAMIKRALADGETFTHVPFDDEAFEGSILEHIARRHERNRALRQRKITVGGPTATLALTGRLDCEVCGFNFGAAYDTRGDGYVEIHHVKPLHVSGPTRTRLSNLAVLCANCHRMCHRGPWLRPSQLADLIVREGTVIEYDGVRRG